MRLVWLVGLVGCAYQAPATGQQLPTDATTETDADADADTDATADVDAPPDTPVAASCAVGVASANGTDRGQVGANGGTLNATALACSSPAERIVGLALRMSNQTTDNGGRSAHAMQIACATVTVTSSEVTVGAVVMREASGAGGFNWTPSTLTPTTMCQPGWVVSGVHAHEGSTKNLFVDVSIQCTEVTTTGAVGASESITVTGSLTNNQNASAVDCDQGEVVTRMPNRTGAGLDAVRLSCSTPICM